MTVAEKETAEIEMIDPADVIKELTAIYGSQVLHQTVILHLTGVGVPFLISLLKLVSTEAKPSFQLM